MTFDERIEALARHAEDWQDPDHEPRSEAVRALLEGTTRFTEESLAFALNHRMNQFSRDRLADWLGAGVAQDSRTVGVSPDALDPLGGLEAAAAALALGHDVVLESPTPLVAAFVDELADALGQDVHAASMPALIEALEAWVVERRADDDADLERESEPRAALAAHVCRRGVGESAVVLGGAEGHEALSGIAEDLLLHEGLAPGTPRLVWAPAGVSPDTLLNALVGFRELFPAHPDTEGSLSLPTALLAAANQPHATGPGFLVSLGEPEPQAPGHIRWVEYQHLGEAEAWIKAHADSLARVVAVASLHDRLDSPVPLVTPGDVHRAPLDPALPAFLRSI